MEFRVWWGSHVITAAAPAPDAAGDRCASGSGGRAKPGEWHRRWRSGGSGWRRGGGGRARLDDPLLEAFGFFV